MKKIILLGLTALTLSAGTTLTNLGTININQIIHWDDSENAGRTDILGYNVYVWDAGTTNQPHKFFSYLTNISVATFTNVPDGRKHIWVSVLAKSGLESESPEVIEVDFYSGKLKPVGRFQLFTITQAKQVLQAITITPPPTPK